MATYCITNWVLVLLNIFETTISSVNSRNTCETRPFANALSISDFKYYTTLPFDPIKSDHPLERISAIDLEPPNPTVIVHIKQISNMRCEKFYLSSAGCVATIVWHRSGLGWNHLSLEALSISYWFLQDPTSNGIRMISIVFYDFSGPGLAALPSLKGLPCEDITYRKWPPFLEMTSGFANLWQRMLPWANGLLAWPTILVAPRWSPIATVTRIPPIAWSL